MLWMHHLLIFGLTITLTLFTSCACNDSSSGHPAEKRAEEIDLQSLTDGELEQICTSRGFELVKDTDKETGQSKQYSHNDYIDAAKQCLEIEAEMEQILSENPTLLDDIETEAKKMREEKDRLEKELAKAKEKLQMERNSTNKKQTFIDETIFKSESDIEEVSKMHPYDIDDDENEIIDLDLISDHEESQTKNAPITDSSKTHPGSEESAPLKDSNGTEPQIKEQSLENNGKANNVDRGKNTKEPILDMKKTIQEFRDKVGKDISRLVDLILPAYFRGTLIETFKPAIRISKNTATTAISLVKRYILIMLENKDNQKDNEEMEARDYSETAQA